MRINEGSFPYQVEVSAMSQSAQSVMVVVIETERILVASNLDLDTATTLIALISEDPSTWDQAKSVWPRYRTKSVDEFVELLQFEKTAREAALEELESEGRWVVLDFADKRVFTSKRFMPIERDDVFAMVTEANGDQHCPLSIHLPPWWELHAGSSVELVRQPRHKPIQKPLVDRKVLYGEPLLKFIAEQALAEFRSDSWRESNARSDKHARYPFTLRVHRDWLMTPRTDLDGKYPRQLLHGALAWSSKVTWGQRLRFEDGGPMIAAPNDWPGFENAPVGDQEICVYFELCRELISASWIWLVDNETELPGQNHEQLVASIIAFLQATKLAWLKSPFGGGSIPDFIIECDRRRVPRGAGVRIEGIDGVQPDQHLAGCDCPLCEMIADGHFGVSFTAIDGHHLELDDEFAFSKAETFDEWEREQLEFRQMSEELDRKIANKLSTPDNIDEYSSAWSGIGENKLCPNEVLDHLTKMGFMVAEIASNLTSLGAPESEIHSLNEIFAEYRRSNEEHRLTSSRRLQETLEVLANRYPVLVSKSADLQSLVDEVQRSVSLDRDDLGDY